MDLSNRGSGNCKKISIKQGENLIVVKYEIDNRKKVPVTFRITPHLQFVPKGEQPEKAQEFVLEKNRISSKGHVLYFYTDGRVKKIQDKLVEDLYYAYDACDGRIKKGNTFVNHYIEKQVLPQT